MRHHRPYEPLDTALHPYISRSTAPHENPRQDRLEGPVEPTHRRSTREAANHRLDAMAPVVIPGRQSRRPTSEERAERVGRRREEASDASFNANAR